MSAQLDLTRRAWLASLSTAGSWCAAVGQVNYTPVAVQGQVAPGTGVAYATVLGGLGVGAPVIDQSGNLAFRVFLQTGSAANDTAIMTGGAGGAGSVQVWSREGSAVPGGGGLVYGQNSDNQIGFPVVNGGAVAGLLRAAGASVVVAGPPGSETMLARTGAAVAGLPAGAVCSSFSAEPSLSAAGRVAIVSSLSGGGVDFQLALLTNRGGAMSAEAIMSRPAPGVPGATLTFINAASVSFDGAGRLFFRGSYTGGVGAIFSDRGGVMQPVIRSGDAAPGGAAFASMQTGTAPSVNAAGQMAFRASTTAGIAAIYSEGHGGLHRVALSGGAIPGVAGAQFNDLSGATVFFNARGETLFFNQAFFSGLNRDTVFVERAAGIEIVARQGDPSPIASLTYGTITGSSVRLNNAGQAAFAATLSGPGVTGANDMALFASASPGGPVLTIVREGDTFDALGDGSSIRTIAGFEFSMEHGNFNPAAGAINGHGAFNDQGVLAFVLLFTDGTQGVYTATIPCVSIGSSPGSVEACGGSDVLLSVGASGPGLLAYQWRRGMTPLDDGPGPGGSMISGADTATLTISGVSGADAGAYDCVVTAGCGAMTSAAATVEVCDADFNCDSTPDPDDLGDFINCYFALPPCAGADFNRDGDINADDLGDFINAYFGGCG
ncbi:MAG: choice-of-anchor tandem repeat NxxGxxAF-containing protein [Phycisphaerales bacterium]